MEKTELHGENERLLREIKQGSESALSALMERNAGLVRTVAKRFSDRGAEYEDLMQIGNIGMLKAARSFDFSFGTAFSTYAVPLIAGEIRRFLRDDGSVKVGRGMRRTAILAMREKEAFERQYGRPPHLRELAERLKISTEELTESLDAALPVRSLQEPIGGEEDGTTLGEILPGGEEPDGMLDRLALRQAIEALPEQQRKIVYLRFFRDLSQQQTGKILGLTQVKVSREEKKLLQSLREKMQC